MNQVFPGFAMYPVWLAKESLSFGRYLSRGPPYGERMGRMMHRVLIIDDSVQIHRLIEAWLKHEPFQVKAVDTGAAGLAASQSWRPDLILLDVGMSDMSGFDLCRALKSDETLCRTPVVFLTGANSPADRVMGLNLGAVDYITKPFHPGEFQARVRAALRTKYVLDLLEHRARIDGLTGLHNRAFLDAQLAIETARLRRHPGVLGCVMCDVDHFKSINDTHGHSAGDEVLRGVADALAKACRVEDIVARYGGEEFTILTPGVDADGAAVLAERARAGVEHISLRRNDKAVRVTCSFGVSQFDPFSPESLIERADLALLAAKTAGRNRVVTYAKMMPPAIAG